MSSNSNTKSSEKRKENDANEGRAEKKRRRLALAFNYYKSGTNYLKVCRREVILLICIWIEKGTGDG